jgi:hypothetical protein
MIARSRSRAVTPSRLVRAPGGEHRLHKCRAIAETPVEAAFGDAEVFRQHLDPHALRAGTRQLGESGLDPELGPRVILGGNRQRAALPIVIRYRIANPAAA